MSRLETLSNSPNDIKIQALRDALAEMVTDWHTDRSSPPNFYRTTGLGRDVCKVDTHLDGYQWPFGERAVAIGWKVDHHLDNNHDGGLVLVADHLPKLKKGKKHTKAQFNKAVEDAVAQAKVDADKSLAEMDAIYAPRKTG
jgi:hypothetical protein